MKHFYIFVFFLFLWSCGGNNKPVDNKNKNADSQLNKPYVILVSIDGYRYDYNQIFKPKFLTKISNEGVSCDGMLPSFPSKTFPNHYTLVTGLYPQNHGIIHNYFYDPIRKEEYSAKDRDKVQDGSWYGGTPLWVLANQNQMLSASYFWIGSEAKIKDVYPTYYYKYKESTPNTERVDQVLNWLQLPPKERPHFITLYFSDIDHAGHRYGTSSKELQQAIIDVDKMIEKLYDGIKKIDLPINLIVVSDHGMQNINKEKPIEWKDFTDYSDFKVVNASGTQLFFYSDSKEKNDKLYNDLITKKDNRFEVYRKGNIPKSLHFDNKDRIADVVLSANSPYLFLTYDKIYGSATHGYDPAKEKNMSAIFYACGPAFKKKYRIKSFENIHVYPLISKILDLRIEEPIDGNIEVLEEILIK